MPQPNEKQNPKLSNSRIRYYDDYLSPAIYSKIADDLLQIKGVPGLQMTALPQGLETTEALQFLCRLFECVRPHLKQVLKKRQEDRKFIDERVAALYKTNTQLGHNYFSTEYTSILGLEDAHGRVVIGPLCDDYCTLDTEKEHAKVAPIPEYLKGNHVTLFGPPDTTKMAINAMNAFHRKLNDEPKIIQELLSQCQEFPKWGADDEDSKTPLHKDLVSAGVNLTGCFTKDIKVEDDPNGKYQLKKDRLALPIKRFPGLALPSFFMFYENEAMPLHLYDFALHFFHNWNRNEALVFYVPKLENEEEANYIKSMLETAETLMKEIHPEYVMGTIRLMIVLENPRAVFRVHEIMDELYPYFAGMSLGWHDYLGSAARLFKEDPNYRIPVKADPDIVIKYIKGSHDLLANVVGPRGGIKVGGMYGILPLDNDRWGDSFQATLKGFFRDVLTQMKRDLTGYWVAHPDFVRIGMAIIEAWKRYAKGEKQALHQLIQGLLNEKYQKEVMEFLEGKDIEGLDPKDPLYARSLIVADVGESNIIQNNHPDEIRYNVFQSLQYLTDWLSGNGCVALPAFVSGSSVRVMDDLATAERSRWEVWHELYHGRFQLEDFLQIAFEELNFIRKDLSHDKKIVQVKWTEQNAKWYPVAFKLMIKLMTDKQPVEFATQLLLPFTLDRIQSSDDPYKEICQLDSAKFSIDPYIERFLYYFERCGELHFASSMAQEILFDQKKAEEIVKSFNKDQIIAAASFHGDIGKKKNLDKMAAGEQAKVDDKDRATSEIIKLADQYLRQHGFKFLVSAQGKTSKEMLAILEKRLENSTAIEIENAREALWEITKKRVMSEPLNAIDQTINELLDLHKITSAQIAVSLPNCPIQQRHFGETPAKPLKSLYEIASLSKTIGTWLSLEVFKDYHLDEECLVSEVLTQIGSPLQVKGDHFKQLKIKHLVSHCALNMHYVNGIPQSEAMPEILTLLQGNEEFNYSACEVLFAPETQFQYSGAGFMLLQHLVEGLTQKSIEQVARPLLDKLSLETLTFLHHDYSDCHYIDDGRLKFPAFAAGAYAQAKDVQLFLECLTQAFHDIADPFHATACKMLFNRYPHSQIGSFDFMGAQVGLGLFVLEAGDSRWALHQGANEGFRAIYLHCYDGPDQGKGFTILSQGDLNAVEFVSNVSQVLLKNLNVSGIDLEYFEKMQSRFSEQGILPEEIVNQGYKQLIFNAFEPCLPPNLKERGYRQSAADDLLSQSLIRDAMVVSVSNQRFARAENIFSVHPPLFDPEDFCPQGKVMDSWEGARHNIKGVDELVFEIAEETAETIQFQGVYLSTMYHLGNQVEQVALDFWDGDQWQEFLPKRSIQGHSYQKLKLSKPIQAKKFRLKVYPDGGFTRLAFFSEEVLKKDKEFVGIDQTESILHTEQIPTVKKPLSLPTILGKLNYSDGDYFDNASIAYGAEVIEATNEHYGPAAQVISSTPPIHMFDGLESARSREKNHHESVTIKLAEEKPIAWIDLDFSYFVNNNPVKIGLEGLSREGDWVTLLHEEIVKFYAGNQARFLINHNMAFSQIRLTTYPDGGVNRIHVYSPCRN